MVSLLNGLASAVYSNTSIPNVDFPSHILSICDCLSHILEHSASMIPKHKCALFVDSHQVPASQRLPNATKLIIM